MIQQSIFDRIAMLEAQVAALSALIREIPPPAPNPDNPRGQMYDICRAVAFENFVTVAQLRSASRKREIAWPRQEAMARMMDAGFTAGQIGRFLGRDHTTVSEGAKAARKRANG